MYLAGAELFADRQLFFWRSPLYGLWMGLIFMLCGNDLELCFYVEKYFSTFLLGLVVGFFGLRLFGLKAGILMGIWTLNCKYILLESNGSHIVAGVLFSLSLLSLTFDDRNARLPSALLALLLSTQVRSEMWVPLIFVLLALSVLALRQWVGKKRYALAISEGGKSYWTMSALIGASLLILFNLRIGPPEQHRFSEAFAMNFAMNYVERSGQPLTGGPGEFDWMKIWVNTFPGVSASADAIKENRGEIHPIEAIKKYPREVLAHIGYNLKIFVRALPASFLAFDRPFLMLLIFAVYLSSLVLPGSTVDLAGKWDGMGNEEKLLLVIWALAILTLIPISLVLRVVARYYIQLVPVLIAVPVLAVRKWR